jgi:hypothetical protein
MLTPAGATLPPSAVAFSGGREVGVNTGAGRTIDLAVLSAVIAAVAAGVAVWRSILAGQQAREARKSRELSAVISLFNAHQSEDASHIRRLIRDGTIGQRLDDPEVRVQLRNYLN